MTEKYINIDLEDPRSNEIAEVLSNKTCKRILSLLAEKEMNATEISNELKIPLNTAGYNLEKLVSAGLIEKTKKFFWSTKGKKIDSYAIVNKKIVISPRTSFKGVLATVIIYILVAFGIKVFSETPKMVETSQKAAMAAPNFSASQDVASEVARSAAQGVFVETAKNYAWAWFLFGALVALLVFLIWNWKKIRHQ